MTTAVALAGCGVFGPTEPASELVVRWSENDHPELSPVGPTPPSLRTHLIDTSQKRDELLDHLPPSIPRAELSTIQRIDLGRYVIVLGSYGKCTETSHLELDDEVLTFVIERDEGVDCAVAPVQVEVWSLNREDLPTPIRFRDQRGNPA
ncbi:hypothetical protein [Knoellia subterranea]|uniref:Uncharacterized protein n=1 Tax=Knoellia subterranea KCTC 19937 TaxID=1385521 RepID=A0A0A0JHB8_9MICO|nr:hypothetical protein [Knoellia subterranea]KGN36840.1 hypothetical protein N803_17270 [Knoellia subterranea KCTC 19937]